MRNSRSLFVAALVVLSVCACTETNLPVATGKGNLRGVNAIITSPEVAFLIEERVLGAISYKQGTSTRFDNLSYNVNFDVILAGDTTRTRIATDAVTVVANTEYVFALTGTLAAPTLLRFEYAERQWTGNETVFEGRVLHLAATAAQLDVYFSAPATVPVIGDRRAAVSFGELTPAFEQAAGDYELVLTAHDDPNTILYRSRAVSQAGGSTLIYSVFDPDPSITGNLGVRVMGAGSASAELADDNIPPTIRLMHGSLATGNVDLYANDDFTAPILADVAFGAITPEIDFPLTTTPLTFTPAGDTGVLLLEDELTVLPGTRNTMFLVGAAGELDIIAFQDDHRPVETTGRLRLAHLADNAAIVDLYIFPTGEDIEDNFPRFVRLPFRASTGYANLGEGSYQVAITLPGEKEIIGGPLTLDLALGDVVELAVLDTPDPNVFDVVLYDN
ncbi:MAG TPA: DUF4397 domain-containing protein [Woeseiaceae bacterium]|nr:DUF4397 domain-containing protein [Woeseiaceae bacterium]